MKTKVLIFILSSVVFVTVFTSLNVYGAAINTVENIVIVYNPSDNCYNCYGGNNWNTYINTINNSINTCYIGGVSAQRLWKFNGPNGLKYESPGEVMEYLNNNDGYWYVSGSISSISCTTPVIFVKGTYTLGTYNGDDVYDTYQDYDSTVNPPPEEDSWWEILWDTVSDYFQNPIPGGWITNLINRLKDDENEDSLVDNVTMEAPTIAPTPTNIPYSTIIVPNTDIIPGTTVNEIQYIYNVSGTPIITQSPPPDSGGEGGSGNGGGDYHPKDGDPYSIPSLDWLTTSKLGDTSYNGLDSLSDGMDSINSIGSEYDDGMSTVQDATGVLPSNWLLLIGIAAAIPLIAGIISRFLS